ncbi:MAG: sigma-70 family RNA polymerase sigma factor [Planctomycetaceae bacterium]|nr:sigma-70 family RNA polymerase sigma factor [Planctomycetaceae bacterium]
MVKAIVTSRRRAPAASCSSKDLDKEWLTRMEMELPSLDHVHHRSFSLPGAEERLWGPSSASIDVPNYRLLPQVLDDVPEQPQSRPSLRTHEEKLLFLRYNYAKYRMSKLTRRSGAATQQWGLWRRRAQDAHRKIVHANLPLVPAMAQRATHSGVEFSDLISEGYMAVLRSVEKFDVARGFKFSTYACRSILACFSRLASKARTRHKYCPVQFDPELERSDFIEQRHEQQRTDAIDVVRQVLLKNHAALSDIERTVIQERFGMSDDDQPRTLMQIGKILGLSLERVRQIEKSSLSKIRYALEGSLAV